MQSALAATPSNKEIALYDAIRGGFTKDPDGSNAGSCIEGTSDTQSGLEWLGIPTSISASDYSSSSFYGFSGDKSFAVSAKTDINLGDGRDETLRCETVIKRYVESKYGTGNSGRIAFLNSFYDTTLRGGKYYLKDCISEGDIQCPGIDSAARLIARNKLRNDMAAYAAALNDGAEEWYIAYAKDILLTKFNQCWKWEWNDPANPEERDESNQYNEELWVPKDGRDDSNNVGFLVETLYGKDRPNYEDGVMNCDELKDAVLSNRLLDFNIDDEYDDLSDEEKYQNVLGMFLAEGTDKLLACVAANNPAMARIPMVDLMKIIAKWLVDGDTQIYYPPYNGQPEGYTTAEQTAAIKECLFNAYGEDLETALDEEAPPSTAEDDEENLDDDPGGEKCYDGGKTLFGLVPKNPIKWIVCGLSQLLADAIDRVNKGIESLLEFNPTEGDGQSALKEVWSGLLTTANILFIVAFLIVIISTALDLGIFSNYTVKKLLPRVIIALILANLSFSICANLISITNTLGGAAKEIILAPITSAGNAGGGIKVVGEGEAATIAFTDAINADGSGAFQTAVVAGLGTLVYLAIASGGAILLPVMAIVFVAAIVALTVLLLRRILIIMLIVFAPIAFVLWALPGGEKWFQRWWKLFIQMLLMYPMIMAAFASGIFVSWLITKTGPSTGLGLMTSAMAFVAIVLPYFLIPTLFKAAGGALGNITGMINDRSKGLIDRSKNYRDNSSQYGRRKKLKAAGKEQKGQQELFESLQGDGRRAQYRRHQAFGMKGIGSKNRQRSESVRASMLGQTEEAIHKQQVQGLAESVRGMDITQAKDKLSEVALNKDESGVAGAGNYSDAQRSAAIALMTQYKDVNGLEKVQKQMLKEGKAGKPNSLKTWNDAMGKNFSEMKAISPHLATDVTASDTDATMEAKYAQAFLGATEQNKASMKVEGWQKFNQVAPAASQASVGNVLSNPVLSGSMPSDAASYFNTSTEQATATLAGSTVGQTVLSAEAGNDKVTPWLNATGSPRTEHELRGAHAGLQAKINGLSPEKARTTAPKLQAAQKIIEDYATRNGITL